MNGSVAVLAWPHWLVAFLNSPEGWLVVWASSWFVLVAVVTVVVFLLVTPR